MYVRRHYFAGMAGVFLSAAGRVKSSKTGFVTAKVIITIIIFVLSRTTRLHGCAGRTGEGGPDDARAYIMRVAPSH